MTTYRAYGTPELGKSAMFRVTDTPRSGRRVVSYARGLHYPDPYKAGTVWRCRDCGGRLREYRFRGVNRLRHAVRVGVE